MHILSLSLIVIAVMQLASCSMTVNRPDGSADRHYFGYVKVTAPNPHLSSAAISRSDVTAVGVRASKGIGVGYFRDREVHFSPTCRLAVFVHKEQEISEAVEPLSNLYEEQEICIAIMP